MSKQLLKVALLQLKVSPIKHENYANATSLIKRAFAKHPVLDLLVLPECFNSPYSIKLFRKYCEPIPEGETTQFLQQQAKENNVTIIGGSYPESEGGDIFNTSVVVNPQGEMIAKYRKVHMFDVNIPDKISFQESRVLTAGDSAAYFHHPTIERNIGLGICYDLRFPELAHKVARPPISSSILVYPGAFNMTSGPIHWELLARARALDNQAYVILCSPARDLEAKYVAYGHSLIVDPLGKTIVEAGGDEEVVYAELDMTKVDTFREHVPLELQRRPDVYH